MSALVFRRKKSQNDDRNDRSWTFPIYLDLSTHQKAYSFLCTSKYTLFNLALNFSMRSYASHSYLWYQIAFCAKITWLKRVRRTFDDIDKNRRERKWKEVSNTKWLQTDLRCNYAHTTLKKPTDGKRRVWHSDGTPRGRVIFVTMTVYLSIYYR